MNRYTRKNREMVGYIQSIAENGGLPERVALMTLRGNDCNQSISVQGGLKASNIKRQVTVHTRGTVGDWSEQPVERVGVDVVLQHEFGFGDVDSSNVRKCMCERRSDRCCASEVVLDCIALLQL